MGVGISPLFLASVNQSPWAIVWCCQCDPRFRHLCTTTTCHTCDGRTDRHYSYQHSSHGKSRQSALIFPTQQRHATRWECGATWRMQLNGHISCNVTYDCYPHKSAQGYDPQIGTPSRFFTMHQPPSFIILCLLVRKLRVKTHPQTNKATNKQTLPKTPNVLRYATTLDKYSLLHTHCLKTDVTAIKSQSLRYIYTVNTITS